MMAISMSGIFRLWRILIQGSLILLLAITVSGCGEEDKPKPVVRAIKWIEVSPTTAEQVRKISGVVRPVDEASLSFTVGGTVASVHVDLGDRVDKDDVLAELDKLPFELTVLNAEAELKNAQATEKERKANYERIRALYLSNNASKAEFDQARASFQSAQSRVKAAVARLGLARRDLNKTMLRAPYNGIISMKEIEPFEEIAAGRPIFGLEGEGGGFKISVAVPETLIPRIFKGQRVNIVFPTLKKRCECGEVFEIGSKAQAANAYPVTVKLLEQFVDLRSGMSVEVEFVFGIFPEGETHGDVFAIPISALLSDPGKESFVFVYDEENSTVRKTPVTVINLRENDVLVESGIKEGDIIATAGVEFLTDGQQVVLMQETE